MTARSTAADVVAAVASLPPWRVCFVGIDGFGGAGKTSLAAELASQVPRAAVVSVDDLQGVGIPEWDWPRLTRDVVTPLLAGRSARYAKQSWGEREPSGYAVVPVDAVVVVEGVSATRREADVPWDLTVWVETDEPIRRARTLARDGADMLELWERWIATEQEYARRERPWARVDFVVAGARDLGQ